MYEKIMVPLDGSAASEVAISLALTLNAGSNCQLSLVRMQNLGDQLGFPLGFPVPAESVQAEYERCRAYLLSASQRLASNQQVHTIVLAHQEDVAQALADQARAQAAQLIVMTSHGWEGFERSLRGSVAEELARIAPCPVLIIGPHTEILQAGLQPG
ncbi:MAG: universal stress protein [Vulcanimicrobiota bacterium]